MPPLQTEEFCGVNIDWEIDFEPILSEKDKVQPLLKDINKEELI